MSKIYTRRGDDGSTGLFGGPRVRKDDLRVGAYGEVDELNSALGAAREETVSPHVLAYLNRLSDLLFVLARAANLRAGGREIPWVAPKP